MPNGRTCREMLIPQRMAGCMFSRVTFSSRLISKASFAVSMTQRIGYPSIATAALTAWEWLQREEHLFGAFEIAHHRPKARPNSVCVVHPKTGEEAWWPLFDETGKELFPELMPELDAIKELRAAGRHRSARQLPTYAKRTRKQLIAGVQKRRAERTKPAGLSE